MGNWRLKLSSDKIKPSVANLCTNTTLYRKGFSKQKFDITIYNIQQLICHNQGGENIHWNAQGLFFLRFFFPEWAFYLFSSHTKKGGKALLHYKGLQMYNYTVRSMWSLLGYIIDTDSTSKTRKNYKVLYIYLYIYAKVYTKYTRYIYRSKTRKQISHAKWSVCWLADGMCVYSSMILWQIKYLFHLIVVNS